MANLKSFDESGLHSKIEESAEVVQEYAEQGSFETDSQMEEFLDAMDTSVSAMIELVQRGHATPAQEEALYAYLQKTERESPCDSCGG